MRRSLHGLRKKQVGNKGPSWINRADPNVIDLVAELGFFDLVAELGFADLVADLGLVAWWELLLGRGHCSSGASRATRPYRSSFGSQQHGRWSCFSGKLDPPELQPHWKTPTPFDSSSSLRDESVPVAGCGDYRRVKELFSALGRSEIGCFSCWSGIFSEFSSLLVVAVAVDGVGGENKQKMKGQEWCVGGGAARTQSFF
ncbi:hypothetical protein U1Q18_013499 [Sarracenia purpurea var. burkii]